MRLYTGGYTADMDGAATGIGILVAGSADDALAGGPLGFAGDAVAAGGSPSWVAAHPSLDVLYAALEAGGAVQAVARPGEASFAPLGSPVVAGGLACHVAVAPDEASLVAACWGDGHIVRMALDAAGRPSAPVIAPAAVDPYGEPDLASPPASSPARVHLTAEGAGGSLPFGGQMHPRGRADAEGEGAEGVGAGGAEGEGAEGEGARVSRAHQTAFLPGGLIATTDMGLDLVRFWRAAAGGLRAVGQVVLPKGCGPRHMRWHPSGHLYVITELSHEVFALAPDASGAWRVVAGTPIASGLLDDDTAAELAASRDGEFLYAGVRGSNTIATLRVRGDGSELQPVALSDSGVAWPRHHVVIRDTLLVAGQLGDEVASLALDLRTGVPGGVRHRPTVPSPTCLLPAR